MAYEYTSTNSLYFLPSRISGATVETQQPQRPRH
jgi:hypothetical protein